MRVRTKICGITNIEDAMQAIEAGADALGFVFYPPSPRHVSLAQAESISRQLPPFITRVGLFVNAQREDVEAACRTLALDLLQFHGDESESDCLDFGKPYIKAIRIQGSDDVQQAEKAYPSAQALLVDAYKEGVPGGTGERFDWSLLPTERVKPLILAGGLTVQTIYRAIQTVRPYAVDVSGGVEEVKGKKNHQLVSQFINEVLRASK